MHIPKLMKVGMVAAMAAMMVFSLGVPVFATTGEDGPTPPKQGDPGTVPFPDVQIVSVGTAASDYTLDLVEPAACTTASIAPNASAGVFEAALEGCAGVLVRVDRTEDADGFYYRVIFDTPVGNVTEVSPSDAAVTVRTEQDGNNTGWLKPDGIAGAGTVNVTETVAPHGGYSSLTDYCLQCHSVHNAPNDFALLRDSSVTATCQTCHSLFGASSTGAFDSNFITSENTRAMGSAASRSAYDLGDGGLFPTADAGDIVRGHQIGGTGGGATGDYSLTDGEVTLYEYSSYRRNSSDVLGTNFDAAQVSGAAQDGIYCASCHSPHGNFGQVVNKWVETDPTPVGSAVLTTGEPYVTITFTSPTYLGVGFYRGERKAPLRFDTDAAGPADFYSLVFNQFSTSGTDADSGYDGVDWTLADCPRTPAYNNPGANQQVICITDLPLVSGTYDLYIGNEGISAGSAGRVDWDGTAWWYIPSTSEAVDGPGLSGAATGYATTTDAEGQLVSMWAYKMLSSGPNHQMAPTSVKNYAVSSGETNAWCGTCHPLRYDDGSGLHPTHSASGGCTACHGNPADGTSYDYPHTSTVSRLLKQLPDGLCVTCHTNLP